MSDSRKELRKLSSEEILEIIAKIQEEANKKCQPYIEELSKRTE